MTQYAETTAQDHELPQLKPGLPQNIAWLECDLQRLIRPAAFLRHQPPLHKQPPLSAAYGSTRAWGRSPDVPVDAPWAPTDKLSWLRRQWAESPYDGASFVMQLNLEEIPTSIHARLPASCPTLGVVWVFIDLTDAWTGIAHFDSRPAQSITWLPREHNDVPAPAMWSMTQTLPFATEETIPAIASNWDNLGEMYDDWIQEHYRALGDIQIGGWVAPIQGDHDAAQKTFVCALTNRSFGDNGAIYLHHSKERGFFVLVETC